MKGTLIIILGVIIVVSLGGVFLLRSNKSEDSRTTKKNVSGEISPNYLEYSDEALIKSLEEGNAVLFFAATTWCNTCSALDRELKERSGFLPENLTVLRIDYDRDSANKARYGITQQHTMIHLDSSGAEIKRWVGGGFDTLVQQIN